VSTKLVRTCETEAPSHHPRRVRVFKKGTPKEYWNEQCRGPSDFVPSHFAWASRVT